MYRGQRIAKFLLFNLYTVTKGILAVNVMGIENAVDWSIITVICIIPAGKYLCLLTLRPLILALDTTKIKFNNLI